MSWVVSAWLHRRTRFLSLRSLSGLLVIHIALWFNAHSIINLFSFSATFMERFSWVGKFCF